MIRFTRTSFEDQRLNDQMQHIQDALDEMQLSPVEGDLVVTSLVSDSTEDNPYNFAPSFQVVGPDLNLADDAGREESDGGTSFLAAIMGNLLGDTLTKDGNYLAGVIGAYSVTGSGASLFPKAGLLGIVMDGSTDADGCVVAMIDGGDPSSETHVGAAFKVRQFNNDASTSAEYGLDLWDDGASTDGFQSGTPTPFTVTKADVRCADGRVWMSGSGVPVDGTTGDNFAGPGSLYTRTSNGELYINTGTVTDSVWKIVTHA